MSIVSKLMTHGKSFPLSVPLSQEKLCNDRCGSGVPCSIFLKKDGCTVGIALEPAKNLLNLLYRTFELRCTCDTAYTREEINRAPEEGVFDNFLMS